ncbi:MAG: hypothetical protein C6Y22_01670 [Hapalosiphonaceae cyanobacterium JJU2]|nr:MAG: hypothetical protein C6Y22_01670 [Hapalosiphonaceae cyanobacterium JJU2]
MFCWKNINAIVTLFSFIFGFDLVIPVLNEQAALAQTRRENVGVIECSGIQEGGPIRKYTIQSATLENAKDGFRLILTVKGWKSQGWVSGDRVVYPVARDLKVYDVDYHSDGLTDTTLDIKKNGQFEYVAMPSSRSICLTKGTLTFGTGVKQKLFR